MAEETTRSTSSYRIDPLLGSANYPVWKIKMYDILNDLGLDAYIGDSPPKDAAKDRKALTTIRLRVADKPLVYISKAKDARTAWSTLRNMYEPAGATSVVTLRRKLFRAHCAEGDDIEEHIRTLRGYETELAELGQALSAADFSMTLLTSLPDTDGWQSFISSVDTSSITDEKDPDSSKLIARILEKDLRDKSKNSAPELALMAKSKGKFCHRTKTIDSHDTRPRCFRCGKKSHFIRDCPEPASDSESDSDSKDSRRRHHRHAHVAVTEPDFAF